MHIQHITELFALNGGAFITEAYRNLLKREPDEHGMVYYLGRLAQGHSKETVIAQLARSNECRPHHEIVGLKQLIREDRFTKSWLRIFIRRPKIEKILESINFNVTQITEIFENSGTDNVLKKVLKADQGIFNLDPKNLFINKAEIQKTYDDENIISPDASPKQWSNLELSHQIKHANNCFNAVDLHVAIPSYEDYKVLESCIRSIFEHGTGKVNRIIISDDCSTSIEHISYLRNLQSDSANPIPIDVHFKKQNGGFSANVNNCLSKIPENSDVLLLNSDTEITEHAIEAMTSVARTSLAIVGARLLYPDGRIQHGGGFRNFNEPSWFEHLYRGFQEDHEPALVSSNCMFCTGAALYIPSELRKNIGVFDENFKMGFEDVDYCLRAWEKRHPVVYCGTAKIIHHESATRGKSNSSREIDSKSYFWEKYDSFFNKRIVRDNNGNVRVIFVLKDTGVGGGHRVIFNYANYLCANAFTVEIWALSDAPLWFALNQNIIFRTFESFDCLETELSPIEAIKIATWWETAMPVWRASFFKGLPVWLAQDFEISYYKNRDTYNEMRCFASYRPEFVYIVNYKWLKKLFNEEMFFRVNYVGLAIDSETFFDKKRARTPNSVLVCARGEPLKGFSFSKEIIKILLKNGFYVTAYGGDSSLVEDLIGINFIKNPSDALLSELYNAHCYFLQTSIHEGFSLPPIEAMNCGCIPVVTEAHGNIEYIKNNYNCIVIDRNLDRTVDVFSKLNYYELITQIRPGMDITSNDYNWSKRLPMLNNLLTSIADHGVYGKTSFL